MSNDLRLSTKRGSPISGQLIPGEKKNNSGQKWCFKRRKAPRILTTSAITVEVRSLDLNNLDLFFVFHFFLSLRNHKKYARKIAKSSKVKPIF